MSTTSPATPRTIVLLREGYPSRPALDTAISKALLRLASRGEQPETLRLYRPGPVVAFGPQDASSPGFVEAVRASRMSGFEAVLRLAGGRAAVFHPRTLAFSWTIPDPSPRSGIAERFQLLAQVVRDALKDLGVDARIGEVPGEYCPGDYSVNARGRTKLMGVGQRLDQAAAHVGGVIVIGDARRVRDVLVPVYEALELAWDPSTAGSIEEEVGDTAYTRVEAALLEQFSRLAAIEEGRLSPGVLDLAYAMERDVRVV